MIGAGDVVSSIAPYVGILFLGYLAYEFIKDIYNKYKNGKVKQNNAP